MHDKRIKGSVVKGDTSKSQKCRPVAILGGSRSGDDELAKLAWAVAHPARVRLLRILIAHNACMCGELVDHMELAQSTVSQHLKILKEAGLIQGEVDGPKVCYCVNPASLSRLKKMVATL
jgi:ArsR family transcriptional regulator